MIFSAEAAEQIIDMKVTLLCSSIPTTQCWLPNRWWRSANDDVIIDDRLLNDVCDTVQVQARVLNGEDSNHEIEDNDNAKKKQTELKAYRRVLELVKDNE